MIFFVVLICIHGSIHCWNQDHLQAKIILAMIIPDYKFLSTPSINSECSLPLPADLLCFWRPDREVARVGVVVVARPQQLPAAE
jgi:hypothetical protein